MRLQPGNTSASNRMLARCFAQSPRGALVTQHAFTLIELLVVIAVIIILLGAIIVAGTSLVDSSKTNSTKLLLTAVQDVVEEFNREKPGVTGAYQQKATGSGHAIYKNRYGLFPPDELDIFTADGLPGSDPASGGTLAVGKAVVVTGTSSGGYPVMRFHTDGPAMPEFEHRDVAALVLAVEMFGNQSKVMLDRIPGKNRSPGALDNKGEPIQFLDRGDLSGGGPDGSWQEEVDLQIRYIVDNWGNPIRYFAQRDFPIKSSGTVVPSSNHADWNQVSTEVVRLNGGQPVIMSLGPNGDDQATEESMQDITASFVEDWMANSTLGNPGLTNPFNLDNAYANEALAEKLLPRN